MWIGGGENIGGKLTDCYVTDNQARTYGGGIYVGSTITINSGVFEKRERGRGRDRKEGRKVNDGGSTGKNGTEDG